MGDGLRSPARDKQQGEVEWRANREGDREGEGKEQTDGYEEKQRRAKILGHPFNLMLLLRPSGTQNISGRIREEKITFLLIR